MANLYRANLYRANLYRANLEEANLKGANLEEANLEEANLEEANLYRANLKGANLRSVKLPSPGIVLLASWGALSSETTLALMRLDAHNHPDGQAAFDRWATEELHPCPYTGCHVQRVANFNENYSLWSWGPAPTLYEAMMMVLKEKCIIE